jgi:hypothetical protein
MESTFILGYGILSFKIKLYCLKTHDVHFITFMNTFSAALLQFGQGYLLYSESSQMQKMHNFFKTIQF